MTGLPGLPGPVVGVPVVIAAGQGSDSGGQGEDFGKSTPVGFVILLLFFVAVAFLVRSMTKHLKRVPASFDQPEQDAAPKPTAEG